MRKTINYLCAIALLAGTGLSLQAQDEVDDKPRKESCESVKNVLAEGGSAAEAVRVTRLMGMGLAEATVYAMVCGGEANRIDIATAGVAAAENLAQAQSVAYAVLATGGETGPLADAVRGAVNEYARLMSQPKVYQDEYTPLGRGVSPAA